ncbi:SDR family NAD(P)-dependent oxidoreductase [Hydrogenophaga sp. PAMC20947]|uniref:SDR family NAD(P)-dependent oxidoreductase n=1 Tax=Hydrogenophaga sp. PAMC20947 TaxID=2565558 RepID=UPI00109E301E|nr:SDR family NAD(P)-dependent oxidoreductase [Hydrogenophaga sp. PAMC20947]QCB47301.1 SDR family NAD(P)-dependent oxidoreductase [Hydrogenophaga sp. PAMC20947]
MTTPKTTPLTMLITGATDGIGLATARQLAPQGHTLLLHGRNPDKLANAQKALLAMPGVGRIETYVADLSHLAEVESLAQALLQNHQQLDVLINNAGIYRTPETRTADGLDVRFAVNTVAPYLLTQRLLPLLGSTARVVNLSSAAQAPVDLDALAGRVPLADMAAYAQSKLAITMWTNQMAFALKEKGLQSPMVVSVNPGSLLATKMVKEGFGVAGNDIAIGADVLCRAALAGEFADAGGKYFDNDAGRFGSPHPDALDAKKNEAVADAIEAIIGKLEG